MKPNITVYTSGGPEETKKLDDFISAAFWIGVDHTEGDLTSVKVRLPSESYDNDVTSLMEFTSLLVQRQINFSVEFFAEPPAREVQAGPREEAVGEGATAVSEQPNGDLDFETELARIKEEYSRGLVTKKQFESKKGALLKRWKEGVEGRLGR